MYRVMWLDHAGEEERYFRNFLSLSRWAKLLIAFPFSHQFTDFFFLNIIVRLEYTMWQNGGQIWGCKLVEPASDSCVTWSRMKQYGHNQTVPSFFVEDELFSRLYSAMGKDC